MITAQDIREKTFDKARMGGYDMASVDDFLETLADEIAASQKENAVLKSKMKVLVDKIEEYRANEEALNMAILSAQKLAVQIEAEARQRASATVAEAEAKAKAVIGSIDEERISCEQRLAEAKEAKSSFIAEAKAMIQAQLDKLSAIDAVLLRMAPKIPNAGEVLAKFGLSVSPAALENDTESPALIEKLSKITKWKDPVKRGKRVFDDKEFAQSVSDQFKRNGTLSPRQRAAISKMLGRYKDQVGE